MGGTTPRQIPRRSPPRNDRCDNQAVHKDQLTVALVPQRGEDFFAEEFQGLHRVLVGQAASLGFQQ